MKRIIAAAVGLAIVGSVAAIDMEREEKIELKFAQDGYAPEVIVLDDFENFAVGATETIRTEAGTEALVTRVADGLLLELNGEQIEVSLPEQGLHRHGDFDVEMSDADGDVRVVEKHVFISETDGLDGETRVIHVDGDDVEWIEDGDVTEWVEGNGTDERHVIIRRGADGDIEVDHDKKVVVIKRQTESDDTQD